MCLMSVRRSRSATVVVFLTIAAFLSNFLPPSVARADVFPQGIGGPTDLDRPTPVAGSAEGLGAVNLPTGAAQTSYSFDLPKGPGDLHPSLGLAYNSGAGPGHAGVGWTLNLPTIVRKGHAGIPQFADPVLAGGVVLDANADEYYADGKLLIPVQVNPPVPHSPANLSGGPWVLFRTDVDDGCLYYFSGQMWSVQTKSGHMLWFQAGETADSVSATALTVPASTPRNPIYRWNLTRDFDASGNVAVYVWSNQGQLLPSPGYAPSGTLFLTDIYYTRQPGPVSYTADADHVHLTWELTDNEPRDWALYAHSPIWSAPPYVQLAVVDVTSATFSSAARQLVREYQLSYVRNATDTRSYLSSITEVGDCGEATTSSAASSGGVFEDSSTNLIPAGATAGCAALPPTTYTYYGASAPLSSFTLPPTRASLAALPPLQYIGGTGNVFNGLPDPAQHRFSGANDPNYLIGGGFVDLNGDSLADFTYTLPAPDSVEFGGQGFATHPVSCKGLAGPFLCHNLPYIYGDWASTGRINVLASVGGSFQVLQDTSELLCSPTGRFCAPDGNEVRAPVPGTGWGPTPNSPLTSSDISNLGNLASEVFAFPGPTGGVLVDLDGDGLPDFAQSGGVRFSTRDRWGLTHPFAAASTTTPNLYSSNQSSVGSPVFADMDGDGILDYVTITKGPFPAGGPNQLLLSVIPGGGNGSGAAYENLGAESALGVVGITGLDSEAFYPVDSAYFAMGDLNGDGFADIAFTDTNGLHTCVRYFSNAEDAYFQCNTQGLYASTSVANSRSVAIADLDGSGINQVLVYDPNGWHSFAFANGPVVTGAPRDGLLQSISNGRGATTSFTYDTVAHGGFGTLPVPVWVVTSKTVTNNLSASGTNQAVNATASYSYSNAIYDPRDRQFVGFQSVTETTSSVAGSPGSVTKTSFATDTCATSGTCLSLIDYSAFHALRGLPVAVEVSENSAAATKFSTVVYDYAFQQPYSANAYDGRSGRSVQSVRKHTYLWGDNQTPTPPSTLTVTSGLPSQAFTGSLASTPTETVTLSLPSAGAQLLEQQAFDGNGNPTSILNLGLVGQDTPVLRTAVWNLPPGDQTGWSFRVTQTQTAYAAGVGTNQYGMISIGTLEAPIREYDQSYDAAGRLTQVTSAPLSGIPAVPAGHPTLPGTAGVFGNGATGYVLRQLAYDGYGNVTGIGSDNVPCKVQITYDSLFNQLPVSRTPDPNGCGAGTGLTTSLVYDRGLEKVTGSLSPSGRLSTWSYDDFGRVTAIGTPHPFVVGAAMTTMTASYVDGSPVSTVTFQTADGTAVSGTTPEPIFWGHARYYDGFGELRAALDQTGTDGAWVTSAVHSSYANGRVAGTYKPWFTSFSPSILAPGALPPDVYGAPSSSAQVTAYDGIGRVKTDSDFDGHGRQRTYHDQSLSVDLQDQEQLAGPNGHQNAHTTITHDGFGRTARVDKWTLSKQFGQVGDNATIYGYLATGEPIFIAQDSSFQDGPTRTMTYDSLGRMATNTETNVGTWTYWHDFDGRVVGTQDSRGCGEDIFYDSIGRVHAKDYIPCGSASEAPAYTAPNLSTGDGTEAFYSYNSLGQLTDRYDRASHMRYGYDGRGRITLLRRYLALPNAAATLGASYEKNWYSESLKYSYADRVVTKMVGYDALILGVGNAIATEKTSYTADGRIETVTGTAGNSVFTNGYSSTVLGSVAYNADGTVGTATYGDISGTTATYGYDPNGTVTSYHLTRSAGTLPNGAWANTTPAPVDNSTTEADLTNLTIAPDWVGNPLSVTDGSTAAWPGGAAALNRSYTYDDDYRVSTATQNSQSDYWMSPFAYEEDLLGASSPYDPIMFEPHRVESQAFTYDLRGNIVGWTDDASDVPDRSLGATVSYGTSAETASPGFDQLDRGGTGPTQVTAIYDTAGNVTNFWTTNSATNTVSGVYSYLWDETGKLQRAIGYGPSPNYTDHADETYVYDSAGRRIQIVNNLTGQSTFNVFGMLVVKNLTFNASTNSWSAPTAGGTHVYLGGRVGHMFKDASGTLPTVAGNQMHTFIRLPDVRGSNGFVIDSASGEVVERSAYQVYGAPDADYRPPRWNNNREDFKWTGNWDNAEVGLVYMNSRYYAPTLGRFLSPDPRTIHRLQGDPNPYEYCEGNPIARSDPSGLGSFMIGAAAGAEVGGAGVEGVTGFWANFGDSPGVGIFDSVSATFGGKGGGEESASGFEADGHFVFGYDPGDSPAGDDIPPDGTQEGEGEEFYLKIGLGGISFSLTVTKEGGWLIGVGPGAGIAGGMRYVHTWSQQLLAPMGFDPGRGFFGGGSPVQGGEGPSGGVGASGETQSAGAPGAAGGGGWAPNVPNTSSAPDSAGGVAGAPVTWGGGDYCAPVTWGGVSTPPVYSAPGVSAPAESGPAPAPPPAPPPPPPPDPGGDDPGSEDVASFHLRRF